MQSQTQKWQIFSNRHFQVSVVLSLSPQAQRYTWQTFSSETQRALEALDKGAGPDGLYLKALKTRGPYKATTLSRILTSFSKPHSFLITGATPWLPQV